LNSDPFAGEVFYLGKDIPNIELPVCLCTYQTDKINDLPMGKASIACLDINKLEFPLKLRKWEKGDWFIPLR
jgi:tRNA(Ile)-lysidine synthase